MSDKSTSKKGKRSSKSSLPVSQAEAVEDSLPATTSPSSVVSECQVLPVAGPSGIQQTSPSAPPAASTESHAVAELSPLAVQQIAVQVAQIFSQQSNLPVTPHPTAAPTPSGAQVCRRVKNVMPPPSWPAALDSKQPRRGKQPVRRLSSVVVPVPQKRRRLLEADSDDSDVDDSDSEDSDLSEVPSSLPLTESVAEELEVEHAQKADNFAGVPDYSTLEASWLMSSAIRDWFMKRADSPISFDVMKDLRNKYSVQDEFEPFFPAQEVPPSLRNVMKATKSSYRNQDRPYFKAHKALNLAVRPVLQALEAVITPDFDPAVQVPLIKEALGDAAQILASTSHWLAEIRQARLKPLFRYEYKDLLQDSKPSSKGFFDGNLVKAINASKKSVSAFRVATKEFGKSSYSTKSGFSSKYDNESSQGDSSRRQSSYSGGRNFRKFNKSSQSQSRDSSSLAKQNKQ